MDQRLIDAAQEGDIDAMYALLHFDSRILERVDQEPFIDTPLHIAVKARQTSFAMEIANLKPSFAKKLNQDGYSPMHLASAMGDISMMKELLTIGHELCLLKGREKRTPLHCAAMSGCTDIINELLHDFPKSIVELTVQKETVLHLALKNNQWDAFELLLDWVKELDKSYIVNWKDNKGNTVLHLAISREASQAQAIKDLLSIFEFGLMMKVFLWVRSYLAPKFLRLSIPKVEVNAVNAENKTPLDILLQREDHNEELKKIKDILRRAKARKGNEINPTSPSPTSHPIQVSPKNPPKIPPNIPRHYKGWMGQFVRVVRDCPMEVRNALLVVAVLTAAATFQTGVNPPGGVWQDNYKPDKNSGNHNFIAPSPQTEDKADSSNKEHKAGKAIMATHMWGLSIFTICNLSGFLISYAIIILLTHGFPLRTLLLLALHSVALTYMISLCIISPLDEESIYLVFPVIGLGLVILFLLYMGAIAFHYAQKKRLAEREQMGGA